MLASGLAAAAVAAGLSAASPPRARTEAVVVTSRDVAGGRVLGRGDLTVRQVPAGSAPPHAFTRVAEVPNRPLVAPKRAGVAVTDLDVVDPGLLARYGSGTVAVPVRVADAGSLVYLRVGDRVDLIAADTVSVEAGTSSAVSAVVVASDVPVLAVGSADVTDAGSGGLLLVAATSATARAVAGAAVTSRLSVALRPAS